MDSTPEKLPNKEPIEPFIEESISFEEETRLSLGDLAPPVSPFTKEALKSFFLELHPFMQGVALLKTEEKLQLKKWLKDIVRELAHAKFNPEFKNRVRDFVELYEGYLAYPTPFDLNTLLNKLAQLEKYL